MKPAVAVMTEAVLRAGLVSPTQLDEFRRWNPNIAENAEPAPEPRPLEESAQIIAEALQSEGYVLLRETDLEALHQYIATTTRGRLHIELPGQDPIEFEISFGKTKTGDFIIPWRGDNIYDALANGLTYLSVGEDQIFFSEVRELFYGEHKTFMVCVPVRHVG